MKVIPTKIHGVLDYLAVATCFALPRMLNWGDRVTSFLTVVGVIMLVATLLTRFELGLIRVLPMKVHLLLDFMTGALLAAAPFVLFPDADSTVKAILVGMGIFEIGAALLTHNHSPVESHGGHGQMPGVPHAH